MYTWKILVKKKTEKDKTTVFNVNVHQGCRRGNSTCLPPAHWNESNFIFGEHVKVSSPDIHLHLWFRVGAKSCSPSCTFRPATHYLFYTSIWRSGVISDVTMSPSANNALPQQGMSLLTILLFPDRRARWAVWVFSLVIQSWQTVV